MFKNILKKLNHKSKGNIKGYVFNSKINMFYMKNNVRNGEPQEASSRPLTSEEQISELEMDF
jgi:hypothetical protein